MGPTEARRSRSGTTSRLPATIPKAEGRLRSLVRNRPPDSRLMALQPGSVAAPAPAPGRGAAPARGAPLAHGTATR